MFLFAIIQNEIFVSSGEVEAGPDTSATKRRQAFTKEVTAHPVMRLVYILLACFCVSYICTVYIMQRHVSLNDTHPAQAFLIIYAFDKYEKADA